MSSAGDEKRAAPFTEVVEVVEALRGEVQGLRADLVPRDELRQRWRRGVVTVLVAAALTLTVENVGISRCFLSRPEGLERRACGIAFPGSDGARRQGDARLAQFGELLRRIPEQERRITELERRGR